jgi:transcriptional regulator with XRE-family HTH domain
VTTTARERAPLHRRRLGRSLRRLRERAGLTQVETGRLLEYSDSKISRVEAGQLPDFHAMCAMLDLYGLTVSQWEPLKEQWRIAKQPGWWASYKLEDQGYISMEDEAVSVREYQPSFIPGLLQTEEYARAFFNRSFMLRSRQTIENQIVVRIRRQDRLTDKDNPLEFIAIIQEGVLRRYNGDPAVHRAQLRRIIERVGLPNVTVQVLREAQGVHDGLSGSMIVLNFPDKEDDDVVYLENALGANHTDNTAEVTAAKMRLDHLARLALDPAQSIEFIEQVAAEL